MGNDIIVQDDKDLEGWHQATRSILPETQPPGALTEDEINQARSDFNTARENLLDLIKDATSAVQSVGELAQCSQSWQYYNVLQQTIKTAVETNEKLVQLHETRKKIGAPQGPKMVKQQLVVTSAALLEMLQDGEKK